MVAFRPYILIRSGIVFLALVCLGSWHTFHAYSQSDSPADKQLKSESEANAPSVAPGIFLAAVEQFGVGSGSVDLFNVTLGGSGAVDTFSASSPATVPVTNSTNENKPDIDNPLNALFDTSGDLLVGNGGTTTGTPQDNGSFACIPASAISTAQNSSTTISTNVDDPVGIAYDKRDGSVAFANNPTSSPVQLVEFLLNGGYFAAPSGRNLTAPGYGSFSIANLPTLPAGTYAIGLTDGTETDPAHSGTGKSKIAIVTPTSSTTSTETDITDTSTFAIDIPHGLAWDATNNQLVIANFSTWHRLLSFYTVSPVAQVKTINTTHRMDKVATSPDGHVAVSWNTSFGTQQVQVYDNTAARNPVNGPIPFNGTTTSCGSTYIYGSGGGAVNSLTWLSNTKLLVALQVYSGSNSTAQNGLYIYDISATAVPAGFDDVSCSAFAAAPKQTGFVHINNKPLGAAVTTPTTFAAGTGASCGTNPSCYTTLSQAMANTPAGGILNVLGGTFNESVTLNNNVIMNLDADTTVNDFTISPGATLNGGGGFCSQANGAALTLKGNWSNSGTFNAGGGTIAFAGTSGAQAIGGNATAFNNLIINNSSGVSFGNNETVGGALTLTNGALGVGTNTLTLNGAVSAASGSITSGASGTVIYNQQSAGQAIAPGQYGNLTFSNFAKTLPGSSAVKIAGAFSPGSASGHTVTGSTVEFDGAGAQTLPSAFPTYNNLTLNDAAGTTGFSGLTVNGLLRVQAGTFTGSGSSFKDVQIDSGATLAGTNAATINVSGSWTNNGTFTANGNTVNFNGSSAQILGGTQSTTFNNLLLSNTSGISLGNNISVAATLQVNANVLFNLGAFDVPTVGALVNSGDIRKTQLVSGTGGKTFGLAGSFNGANLTVGVGTQGTLSSLQVDRFDSNHPNATLGQQTGRYWVITPTGTGYSVNLTLPRSNPGAPSACRYTGTGAVWDCDVSSSTANTVTRNNVTTLSPWAVGNNAITPPTIGKAFSATSIQTGGQSTVTLTLSNSNINNLVSGAFTDTLTNMSAVGGAVGGTCSGTAPNTLTAGATSLSFSGIIIPANGSCTVTFPVTSSSAGALTNTTSGVTTLQTPTAGTASNTASLTVYTPPSISKAFSPTAIAAGGQSTVTLTLTNSNTTGALTNAALTDTLTNMSAAGGAVGGTCVGTTPSSLSAGSTNLSFTGITIPTNGSCTVTFPVTSNVAGINSNTASGVTTAQTSTAGAASNTANLTVTGAPLIQKSFTPATVGLNGISTLTITITNPGANTTALTGVGVSDTFPAGMEVDATPATTNSCATGTFAPAAAATSISISGASIPVSTACTFTVKVKGTSFGDLVNTTGNVTSTNGGTGLKATATLSVVTLEGDVTPRSSGDGKVDATDVQQIERFAVGFDKPYQSNEGQRADVAPRLDTSNNFVGGDGQVDATDVQQAERYAIGTDPLTPAGGPTTVTAPEPGNPEPVKSEAGKRLETSVLGNMLPKNLLDQPEAVSRALSIQPNVNTSAGQTVVVNVLADIAGDETRYTFSLSYDQTKLTNPSIPTTGPISGETVLSNTNTAGQIGVSIGHGGVVFPAGNGQVLLAVTFTVANNAATGPTPINFTNTPAAEATSNAAAQPLATTYTNGAVTINQPTAAPVTVSGRVTDSSGRGIMGATVHITKQNGDVLTTRTNSFGYYEIKEVEVGETIIINVYAKRYQFETQVVTVTEDRLELNFAPMPGIVKGNDGLKAPQKQEKEEKDELKQP